MGYTQTDLDNILAAKVELATGKRVVRVTVAGKTTEYAETELAELTKLQTEVEASISSSTTNKKFFLTQTHKGL